MEATAEQKDILERVVVNAQRVITHEKTSPKFLGFLEGGQSVGEGFSLALTYVLKKVVSELAEKGVEVTPAILMSENGAASQVAQLIVSVIEAQGKDISPNEIKKGLEVSLHNFSKMLVDEAKQPVDQPQGPPQGPPQGQVPQQPQQPQQPQGMLGGAMRGGA